MLSYELLTSVMNINAVVLKELLKKTTIAIVDDSSTDSRLREFDKLINIDIHYTRSVEKFIKNYIADKNYKKIIVISNTRGNESFCNIHNGSFFIKCDGLLTNDIVNQINQILSIEKIK